MQVSLRKYAWQWGVKNAAAAIAGTIEQALPVSIEGIKCPALFLVSEGEGLNRGTTKPLCSPNTWCHSEET